VKTYLVGSYGQHNAGDDAFVEVALWGMQQYCLPSNVIARAPETLKTSRGSVKADVTKRIVKGQHFVQRYLSTLNLDRILYVGGGIHTFSKNLIDQQKIFKRNKRAKGAAIGVSVGPFRNIQDRDECNRLLEKFEFVGVRGKHSYNLLKEIDAQVRYELTFDVAPLLNEIIVLPPPKNKNRKNIGISLLDQTLCCHPVYAKDELEKQSDSYIKIISEILNKLLKNDTDIVIYLLEFCSHYTYADSFVLDRLKNMLTAGVNIQYVKYSDNPLELFNVIREIDCMIAMRLHAAVFAYSQDVPCLLIPYQNKCFEWAETIGVPECDLIKPNIKLLDQYYDRLDFLLKSCANNACKPVYEAITAARRNFEVLSEIGF